MPEVITLVPTWEAAAQIYLGALSNPDCPDKTRYGAEQEILSLARSYDALIADVDEEQKDANDGHPTGPDNVKPYGTVKDARLYIKGHTLKLSGTLVSHDNPRHLKLGEMVYTSQVVSIGLVDICLVVETSNTNYVIEGDLLR